MDFAVRSSCGKNKRDLARAVLRDNKRQAAISRLVVSLGLLYFLTRQLLNSRDKKIDELTTYGYDSWSLKQEVVHRHQLAFRVVWKWLIPLQHCHDELDALTIIAEYLESSGTKHTLPPTDAAEYSYCPSGDSRVYRLAPCRVRG
jgi:hypothetical protein